MKSNICLLSIDKRYSRIMGKKLSENLGMFFADINALLQFDIINIEEAKTRCGLDYIKKLEESKVKSVVSFDNTLFTLNWDMLNNDVICKNIKEKALTIFLDMNIDTFKRKLNNQKIDKSDKSLQIDMFLDRTEIVRNMSDINILCDNKTPGQIISDIKKSIIEYYNKR